MEFLEHMLQPQMSRTPEMQDDDVRARLKSTHCLSPWAFQTPANPCQPLPMAGRVDGPVPRLTGLGNPSVLGHFGDFGGISATCNPG